MRCLEQGPLCDGPVEERPTPPYGERSFPRCIHHHEMRWSRFEGSIEQEALSPTPPAWFDPAAAGERWDEDD